MNIFHRKPKGRIVSDYQNEFIGDQSAHDYATHRWWEDLNWHNDDAVWSSAQRCLTCGLVRRAWTVSRWVES